MMLWTEISKKKCLDMFRQAISDNGLTPADWRNKHEFEVIFSTNVYFIDTFEYQEAIF